MAKKNDIEINLKGLDDLFSSQEERNSSNVPKICNISLDLIDDFPNHPFKVRDDKDMQDLVESVSERGVLVPALVRPKADGRYEMVSGHRRKRASILNNKDSIDCIVKDLTDDEAIIIMVDSNIQRTNIPPSEKGFAYKMRLDAMKRQGKRTDLTCAQVGHKSRDLLAQEMGESREQIRRYIRLTYLVPELLEYVDNYKIKLNPAVELSYLDEDSQRDLVDYIDDNESTPSHAQSIRMHKLFNEGTLTREVIYRIMDEEKPNQREKLTLNSEKVKKLIPTSIPITKREEYVCKALEYYGNHIRNRTSREAR